MRRKYDPEDKSSREEKNRGNKTQPRSKQLLTQALERLEANFAAENYRQSIVPTTVMVAPAIKQEWYPQSLEPIQDQAEFKPITIPRVSL